MTQTEAVAQLVRASDCGSEGRGFETLQPPQSPPPKWGIFNFLIMPIWILIFIPVFSAVIGWILLTVAIRFLFRPIEPRSFAGIRIQGFLPARLADWSVKIAELAERELFSSGMLKGRLSNPDSINRITPFIEEHIDHFLRVKLKESMPMIGMLIGEKTIAQLKSVFLSELQQLFPVVMEKYAGTLQEELNLQQLIRRKMESIPPEKIEIFCRQALEREFRILRMLGAVLGLIIGILNIILLLIVK